MGELKPCPFCGGEAELHEITFGEKRFFIDCSNGECPVLPQTDSFGYKEPAIHVWNTRQSPKAMIADEVIGEIVKEIAYNQKAEDQADDFIEKVWLLKEWLIKIEVCKPEQEG